MSKDFGIELKIDTEYIYVTLWVGENKANFQILCEDVKEVVCKVFQSRTDSLPTQENCR